jgi:rhodanese-related sulfurtransferase
LCRHCVWCCANYQEKIRQDLLHGAAEKLRKASKAKEIPLRGLAAPKDIEFAAQISTLCRLGASSRLACAHAVCLARQVSHGGFRAVAVNVNGEMQRWIVVTS